MNNFRRLNGYQKPSNVEDHPMVPEQRSGAAYVIAEVGSNHNHDLDMARRLIDMAATARVDAVKFQTLYADDFIGRTIMPSAYGLADAYPGKCWQDVLGEQLILPFDWYPELVARIRDQGMDFVTTVHSDRGLEFVLQFQPSAIKIASMDLTHTPLLASVARGGVPMILSIGMGSLSDIERAVETVEAAGCQDLTLLHCVSEYPADYETLNLRSLRTLADAFGWPVGFSDHSLGVVSSVVAVTIGATVIEKHITLDRGLPGPDHPFALDADDLARLVREIRQAEACLGSTRRVVSSGEARNAARYRRSAVAREPLPAGTVLTRENVAIERPGTGIQPHEVERLWGRAVQRDVDAGQPLTWQCVGGEVAG